MIEINMELKIKHFFILCILSLLTISCAHVISKEYATTAEMDIPFQQIIRNTDAYLNKLFIFGGIIAETKITSTGTEIEVVQTPLDRLGNIIDRDISGGRFIITTTEYLDPLIYRNGRDVTVAGILTGSQKRLLGKIEYVYPSFNAKELYLWKEEKYYRYPYMYPYRHGPFYYPFMYYPYDPFWHRPYMYP